MHLGTKQLTFPDNFCRHLGHQVELLGSKQSKDSLNDKDAFSFLPDGKAEYQGNSNPLCRLSRAEAPVYFSVGRWRIGGTVPSSVLLT